VPTRTSGANAAREILAEGIRTEILERNSGATAAKVISELGTLTEVPVVTTGLFATTTMSELGTRTAVVKETFGADGVRVIFALGASIITPPATAASNSHPKEPLFVELSPAYHVIADTPSRL
jgi:hypothetical protein